MRFAAFALFVLPLALGVRLPAEAAVPVFAVHGTVLAVPAPGTAVVAIDAVPALYAEQTRRFHVLGHVRPGESIDALLDTKTSSLSGVNEAATFAPGLPNRVITHVFTKGDTLPPYAFETQTGRFVHFADLRGKVVLLSFVYTHCPDVDICPAISGKFAYLQHHLDPKRFALVEMTLDPVRDSPAVLAAYGAQFGALPSHWMLVTGESAQIKNVLDAFALDPIETDPGRIIHGDTLAIVDRTGRIADIIPTAGWVPDDVIATANDVAGVASNPLRRFELATIAGVIAFCGGSITTPLVILDSTVFVVGAGLLIGFLIWITKRVIVDERY
jgi:protein SCO1/2